MMVFCLATVLIVEASPSTTGLHRYASAREAFLRGDMKEAERGFSATRESDPELRAPAEYAMGTMTVLRAADMATAPTDRERLLHEAIRHFRTALDAPEVSWLARSDIEHNLVVAKHSLGQSRESMGKPDPGATGASKATHPQAAGPTPAGAMNEAQDKDNGAGSRLDQGPVERPHSGSGGVDPGPITAADAQARLEAARRRIRREMEERRRLEPVPLPVSNKDF